ncbi:MAG: class I SAM-dependent DNA methyltransferase [Rubrobacter sp.]|nr:class I SAM-dependent DNA methyltransferase [Rubrobacter sp.]
MVRDENGEPKEPEWPEADVIVGNPPFLGGNKIRAELGGEYVEDLFELYKGCVPAFADLVCYWFERARRQVEEGKARRVGLLATNSIRGGVNRRVLERTKDTGDIFFAESDRPWILNGAAVRVSMVGFDNGSESEKRLGGAPVQKINADLTGDLELSAAQRLNENAGLCFYGSQQKGSFDITPAQAKELLAEPNPFGLDTKQVVRPATNGAQLLRRTSETWVIDFGVSMSLEEAALYEAPFEYVKRVVYPERQNRSEKRQREYWWLHARPSPRYRKIIESQALYMASPVVSKHRIFVWLDRNVLADHQLVVFALEDNYSFGVLHSRAHELWALRMGTFLGVGNDPRYTPTTCFETFPFPEPNEEQRAEISAAAKRLDELRRNWLNPEGASEAELKKRTLTNLYNQRPTWLANAHARLDAAVYAAYGWPADLPDEEVLKNLLALNLERFQNEG